MIRSAVISPCGLYRYKLERTWHSPLLGERDRRIVFIGLNPSTADGMQDDPTIRRCINFAKAWGYSGLVMLNLFAFRSTDPKGLLTAADPVGPENDATLMSETVMREVVACWGACGHAERIAAVLRHLPANPKCLGKTKDGLPRHPLYVKGDVKLVEL